MATENGIASVNVRISEISGADLTLHLQASGHLNGPHAHKGVNDLVVEARTSILPNDAMLKAGTLNSIA